MKSKQLSLLACTGSSSSREQRQVSQHPLIFSSSCSLLFVKVRSVSMTLYAILLVKVPLMQMWLSS